LAIKKKFITMHGNMNVKIKISRSTRQQGGYSS